MTDKKVTAVTTADVLADAKALEAKILSIPKHGANMKLQYALRETRNAINHLS